MTKVEAIEKAKKGIRITHRYFEDAEWFYIGKNGGYVLEDGVECSSFDFWRWRTDNYWLDGYSEHITNTKTK